MIFAVVYLLFISKQQTKSCISSCLNNNFFTESFVFELLVVWLLYVIDLRFNSFLVSTLHLLWVNNAQNFVHLAAQFLQLWAKNLFSNRYLY